MAMRLDELAARIGVDLVGDGSIEVVGCAALKDAGPDEIAFLANPRYLRQLDDTRAAAVLIDRTTPSPDHLVRLESDDPYFAFRNALIEFKGFRVHPVPMDLADDERGSEHAGPRISPRAAVHPDATVGDGCLVHPFVTIEAGATVGAGCVLYPGVTIGTGAELGDDCVLYPNVTVYDHCVLGDRVTLHSSTVIGQDGFGYATHAGVHEKIPQAGRVVIGDDVEMGAGCVVERAAMGDTSVGAGTKFADLVSIGHGASLGKHCLLVSYAGVAGSTHLGNYVVMGGQSGVVGHVTVGDGVQLAAKSLITSDTPAGKQVAGIPGVDLGTARRNWVAGSQLARFVKETRARLDAIERDMRPGPLE